MSDEPITQPPEKINNPRKALQWLWKWSQAHTVASAAIVGVVLGFVAGKVL